MFKFKDLSAVHLEISNRCQASCPMCPRNIHSGIENPLIKNADWTLAEFKTVFDQEVLNQLSKISFCGSFGDPIMNNDLIGMCEYIKANGRHIDIRIHTNGSARNSKWWKALADAMPENHLIEFGIDGLSDTHDLHRVGTSFERIIENAKTVIAAGAKTSWLYIRFKHNEHQVETARQLSQQLGFTQFLVKNTRRFSEDKFVVFDKQGQISHFLELPSDNVIKFVGKKDLENYADWPNARDISCFALDTTEIYIDANFTIMPCCIIAAFLYTNYDLDLYKKLNLYDSETSVEPVGNKIQQQVFEIIEELGGLNSLDARTQGIKNIIDSPTWQTIWQNKWANNQSACCTVMCSADSPYTQLKAQLVKE